MDGMLSQEEINALLGSIDTSDDSNGDAASSSAESLTADEKDAVGEISPKFIDKRLLLRNTV